MTKVQNDWPPEVRRRAHESSDEIATYYRLVEDAFRQLAPYYDLATWPFCRLRERVADLLSPGVELRVLDVATGTGAQALAFAERGYQVVGADLSVAMIQMAQGKNGAGKVTFEVADATCLPYRNNSFDVSCISFALHDMPRVIQERVLGEMVRVTRPGGTVLVADYDLPTNWCGQFLVYRLVTLYEGRYYREFIRSDLRELLRGAGVQIIREAPALLGAARIIEGLTSGGAGVWRVEKETRTCRVALCVRSCSPRSHGCSLHAPPVRRERYAERSRTRRRPSSKT